HRHPRHRRDHRRGRRRQDGGRPRRPGPHRPPRHHLIYIPDPTVGARGVSHHIVPARGGNPSFHTAALIPQARNALAAEASERGRTPILLIDEGHIFDHSGLDAIRLLTHHDLEAGAPFPTILLGQPDLAQKIRYGIMAAFDQRITVRHHLTG